MGDLEKILSEDTDLAAFVNFYKRIGIDLVIQKRDERPPLPICLEYEVLIGFDMFQDGRETKSDKFDGYSGFYSNIIFDKYGKLISQGFWE